MKRIITISFLFLVFLAVYRTEEEEKNSSTHRTYSTAQPDYLCTDTIREKGKEEEKRKKTRSPERRKK